MSIASSIAGGGGGGGLGAEGGATVTDERLLRGGTGGTVQDSSISLSDTTGFFTQTTANGSITLVPNGTGSVAILAPLQIGGIDANHFRFVSDGGGGCWLRLANGNAPTTMNAGTTYARDGSGVAKAGLDPSVGVTLAADRPLGWTSGSTAGGSPETALWRLSAGLIAVRDNSGNDRAFQTGGLRASVVTKAADYTATANDHTILCDTTAAGFAVTLPAAATVPGQILNIKKVSADGNTLTIDGNGAETIDGAATKTTAVQYTSFQIQSNGTGWVVL